MVNGKKLNGIYITIFFMFFLGDMVEYWVLVLKYVFMVRSGVFVGKSY